jgi:hypothetical protein
MRIGKIFSNISKECLIKEAPIHKETFKEINFKDSLYQRAKMYLRYFNDDKKSGRDWSLNSNELDLFTACYSSIRKGKTITQNAVSKIIALSKNKKKCEIHTLEGKIVRCRMDESETSFVGFEGFDIGSMYSDSDDNCRAIITYYCHTDNKGIRIYKERYATKDDTDVVQIVDKLNKIYESK